MTELKSVKTRIYDAAVMIVGMCVSEHGMGEGRDGDCMPLPTRPQRFCDPASLVSFSRSSSLSFPPSKPAFKSVVALF